MARAKQAAKSAIILVAIALGSKILGFIREQAIAYRFGASYLTDAYYIASLIPLMFFASVQSALNSTLIPVFVEYLQKKGKKEAIRFANNVFNVVAVVLIILVIGGYFLAPALVRLAAPGFTGRSYQVAVELSQHLMIIIFFMGLSGIANGLLNSFKNFTIPALVVLPQNLLVIAAVLFLGGTLGIAGLAIGTVLGMACQLVLQVPALKKYGMIWEFRWEINHPGLKKMGLLIIPVLLGSSVNQVNILVDRILASGLPEGSISALNFASRLSGLPMGLFISAIATVIFPTLAEYAAREEPEQFKKAVLKGIKGILLLIVPMTVGLMILGKPIIQLLFQRGAFDYQDTLATAFALQFYALGMIAIALRGLLIQVYLALQETTLPVLTGVMGLFLNVLFNLILIRYLAHGGLALATSVAAVINVAVLLILLPRKIGTMNYFRQLGSYLAKILLSAGALGVFTYLGDRLYPNPPDAALSFQLWKLGGLILGGAAIYFGMAYFLKVDEFLWLLRMLAGKVYYCREYQVNYLPLSKDIPAPEAALPLAFVEATAENLEDLPNFQGQKVINAFKNKLAEGQRGFLALYRGEVVHHSWVTINAGEAPLDIGRLQIPPRAALICWSITREDLRGKGIFPWVLGQILATLKKDYGRTLAEVYIDAERTNLASLRAMAKAGFQPYALVREVEVLGVKKTKIKRLGRGLENGC